MIYPKHKPVYLQFFKWYTRLMLSMDFRKVLTRDQVKIKNQPVLLIGNHFSWWDGFFAYYLNMKIIQKKFHVMMLEEQLRTRMFLNKSGAYSISKHSKDMLHSINFTADLLKDASNMVVFYPQGVFSSLYQRPVAFEDGISRVLKKSGQAQLIFYAALIDYYEHRKPTLSFYLKNFDYGDEPNTGMLRDGFNKFLVDSVKRQDELNPH